MKEILLEIYHQVKEHLDRELLPFWEQNGVDSEYTGRAMLETLIRLESILGMK